MRSQLRVAAGDLEEAERLLHRAAHLAQQSEHRQAVVYTYAMVPYPPPHPPRSLQGRPRHGAALSARLPLS